MRTTARETLFKIIFSSQFTQVVDAGLKKSLYKADKLDGNDVAYCDEMISLITANKQTLTEEIDTRSRAFPESRIFPADRSVLLIAMAEIIYYKQVPPAVSANEAANIAAKYSSEKSASYVNGILAEIIKDNADV